jgi:uncharacterized membrane protein YkvA (DUF1232 family)
MGGRRTVLGRRALVLRTVWSLVRRSGRYRPRTHVAALPRLLRAVVSGRYRVGDPRRWSLMLVAVAYIVSPFDVLPEILVPVLGFGDDLAVLTWLVGSLLSETETFLDWEAGQGDGAPRDQTIPGEVVD